MFAVWAVFALVMPTTGRWLQRLLLRELRQQIVFACKGRMRDIGMRFESQTRDLFWQINGTAGANPGLQREASQSFFAALEIGHAVIDLRAEMDGFPNAVSTSQNEPTLAGKVNAFIDAVATLSAHPSRMKLDSALKATATAVDDIRVALRSPAASHESRRSMQRALTQMHFIGTAIRDGMTQSR